jgi:hypothetical protein
MINKASILGWLALQVEQLEAKLDSFKLILVSLKLKLNKKPTGYSRLEVWIIFLFDNFDFISLWEGAAAY